jgi:UDP-sugar transporter A1/2/3
LLVEIIKLGLSLFVATYDLIRKHPSKTSTEVAVLLYHSCFGSDSWRLIIPAALYTLQNSLVYVAISNLDAVTFQVTYQLKILTTVLFSILLLGRTITPRQWASLMLLTAGVAIVQTSSPISGSTTATFSPWEQIRVRLSDLLPAAETLRRSVDNLTAHSVSPGVAIAFPARDSTKGILAVLGASLISGLTCVYFEKLLKDSLDTVSLWTRNVQLSFYSLFPALFIGVLWQDGATIAEHGFFVGYRPVIWATIALQAFGGIIVAACMAYADNVAKNYAASASIVVCGVAGAAVFGVPITPNVSRANHHCLYLFVRCVPLADM